MKTLSRPGDSDSLSVLVRRGCRAIADKLPSALGNIVGARSSKLAYRSHHDLPDTAWWRRLMNDGAAPLELLFASTSIRVPKAPDAFYGDAVGMPNTVKTTLAPTPTAFTDHGEAGRLLQRRGRDGGATIRQHPIQVSTSTH
jgi:hypothetical protein